MTALAEVKHFENKYIYFQNSIVYMKTKVVLKFKFKTKKINAWFRKNERKITKLILAGLITAPVLILLAKFLKDGTLSTVEKKTIVSVIEKIDNTPVNNRVLVKLEAPVARVLPPAVENPIVVVPVTKITDSVSKSTTPLSLAVPERELLPKPKGVVKTLASMRSISSVIIPVKRTSKNTRNIMGIDSDNEVKKTQRMRPKTGSSPTASRRSSKTEKK